MAADLLDLKEKIRTEALRLGFKHLGIAQASPVPHYQAYQDWVAQGRHGKMGYLAQEQSVFRRLSVEDNIASVLEMLGVGRKQRKQRTDRPLRSQSGVAAGLAEPLPTCRACAFTQRISRPRT